MARVALLSNPRSTGNQSRLPRIRAFCAEHPDIFHYEVEHADQIGEALRTIARVKPAVLVITLQCGHYTVYAEDPLHNQNPNGLNLTVTLTTAQEFVDYFRGYKTSRDGVLAGYKEHVLDLEKRVVKLEEALVLSKGVRP